MRGYESKAKLSEKQKNLIYPHLHPYTTGKYHVGTQILMIRPRKIITKIGTLTIVTGNLTEAETENSDTSHASVINRFTAEFG